jgi:hypothetical protein
MKTSKLVALKASAEIEIAVRNYRVQKLLLSLQLKKIEGNRLRLGKKKLELELNKKLSNNIAIDALLDELEALT